MEIVFYIYSVDSYRLIYYQRYAFDIIGRIEITKKKCLGNEIEFERCEYIQL